MKLVCLICVAVGLVGCCSKEDSDVAPSPVAEEAIRRLIERGHSVWLAGDSGMPGTVCSLTSSSWIDGQERAAMTAEDAQLLPKIPDLIRLGISGSGEADEFWNALSEIDSVREFSAHYGLGETGIRSLKNFPNLEILSVGVGTEGIHHLPQLKRLKVFRLEYSSIELDAVVRIKDRCPNLEEFFCNDDLTQEQIEVLLSIPTLEVLSAANFDKEDLQPGERSSAWAIRRLNATGQEVGEGSGVSGIEGMNAFLSGHTREPGAKEAQLLSIVENLVEIRVLPNGGPQDEFWEALEQIDSLRDFAVHYGLNEKGVRSLAKFPLLESFTVWGGDYWGQETSLRHLPYLRKLRILHFEESEITTADFRRIKQMCPVLEELEYDYELLPEDIEILRSIDSLKNISADNFEMADGERVD